MGRLCTFLLTLCLLGPGLAAAAEVPPPVDIKARPLVGTAKLGEPFQVEITITHDPSLRYDTQLPDDAGAFDVTNVERKRKDVGGQAVTTFTVSMAGFELGHKTTPTLVFDATAPDAAGKLSVPGVSIEITSVIAPDAQQKGTSLFDVKPPEEVPVRTWRLLWVLGIALAVAGLSYLVLKLLKRRRLTAAQAPAVVLPLDQRTKAALDALRQEDLPAKGRPREFYFRLSEIVRSYLGECYQFDALESTTPELIATLRTLRTPGLPMHQLSTFATESDMVRYAKVLPSADTCKEALELAYRIVEQTTQSLAPPAAVRPS